MKFALLAGVSKFNKVNLFSGLNNLKDITLDPRYSTICGYTEADLDTVFGPELPGLDRDRVRDWYNGYSWRGEERVYNPFDILLLFDTRRFAAHWFETGTPSFLIETLLRRGIPSPELDGMFADDALLSTFDVDEIGTEALLFQTGYLTVGEVDEDDEDLDGIVQYRLCYPNREVRQSLNRSLLRALAPDTALRAAPAGRVRRLLAANDFEGLETLLRALFAAIPYEWHTRNDIARYEGYYASVFYSTSPQRDWTWWWRTAAAAAGRTWRCVSTTACICSSARWWRRRGARLRWISFACGGTRTSIAISASQSISSASNSAAKPATSPASRWSGP